MNTKNLNVYLSNLAVLNAKLHNLHWNVIGKQFVQIHEFTESLYDDLFAKYDEVAELLKMKNENPLVKLSEYLSNATVEEVDAKDFSGDEVLQLVENDLKTMKALAVEIRKMADEEGDFETVAVFEEHVAGYSKNLWFIKAMMA